MLIDTPHKPSDAVRLRAEIERRGKLRYIINTGYRMAITGPAMRSSMFQLSAHNWRAGAHAGG